jgi:FkbM family methyltransferase
MKIYEEILEENSLCFDIGANVGNKTAIMLTKSTKVICVEPQEICVNKLKKRFMDNKNVIIIDKGCGSEVGTKTLYISQFDTLSTMSKEFIETTKKQRFTGVSWGKGVDVQITTLDSLINEYGIPTFCKIDIEGFEFEVLKGLSQPIPYLSLEFTPELKENTFKSIDYLNSLNPNYKFNYSEGESGVFMFSEWVNSDIIKNYLLLNNDFKISFGDLYAKF